MSVKYTFVPQKAKQNCSYFSGEDIYFLFKKKVIGYYLSSIRTLIFSVIGNDEKTYNLYDKTWKLYA